jgi:hypothetical protein
MYSLYTTAIKTSRWPNRFFYGIIDSAALNAFGIFTQNMPSLENIEREATKIIEGTGPCFNHSTCTSEIRGSTNTARCETGHSQFVAFYRHPHQLHAPPSVIQHNARGATFVPDQRTRKPNSSVMSAMCAKITANGCATNARNKS